jgi:hypothetical protein
MTRRLSTDAEFLSHVARVLAKSAFESIVGDPNQVLECGQASLGPAFGNVT